MRLALETRSLHIEDWQKADQTGFEFYRQLTPALFSTHEVKGLWCEGECMGFAVFRRNQHYAFQKRLIEHCESYYQEEQDVCQARVRQLQVEVLPTYQEGVTLEFFAIHQAYQGLGCGSWWIKQLRRQYPTMLLYMAQGSESFWQSQGFGEVAGFYHGRVAAG